MDMDRENGEKIFESIFNLVVNRLEMKSGNRKYIVIGLIPLVLLMLVLGIRNYMLWKLPFDDLEIPLSTQEEIVDIAIIRKALAQIKDLPSGLPEGLCLGATPVREDPRDALATANGVSIDAASYSTLSIVIANDHHPEAVFLIADTSPMKNLKTP